MNKNLTIGIIGLGRFGGLLASILSRHVKVLVYNLNQEGLAERAKKIGFEVASLAEVSQSDIVIATVPISSTEDLIKEVAPMMRPGSLLLDICSVKVMPCQWLKQHAPDNIEIMGTHPMFGPVTAKYDYEQQAFTLEGLQIVLCPLRISDERLEKIKSFLAGLGLEVIVTTPEDHDEQNAITLSLVHFLGRSLKEAGIGEQRIFTPGFSNLLKIYEHTISDDWQLFLDMNNYNPYAKEVRQRFMDACQTVNEKIREDYEHTFQKN
ncbi:prephenate dehydrogenase/arogenate dehydrogenase family protein [Candidatus Falkowbacteria bacterium]|nr:prephenate dehydrogenase/arogenate dehydrogenase family protein [Candidatus Falkowbacteria bacterium]